jgi:hypothetical protein
MAYDAAHQQTVLFGGSELFVGPVADTWVWNGKTWTQQFPQTSPPARSEFAMAYDSGRHQVVLFGGSSLSGALADTWIWDGTNWTQKSPANSPSPRSGYAMTYDERTREVVLFGGQLNADTWVWDGANWTQVFPQASPPGRFGASMVYDATREQIVLFGGVNDTQFGASNFLNDMWVWNGSNWSQASPFDIPSARGFYGMAYDAEHEDVVLFGGSNEQTYLSDTWLYGSSR